LISDVITTTNTYIAVNLYQLLKRYYHCKTDAKTRGKIQAETGQNPAKFCKNHGNLKKSK
jgi:hypothetical protein